MPSSEETYVPERTNVQESAGSQEASTLSSPLADSRSNDTIRAQENSKQSDPAIRNVLASCPLELSNSSTAATNAGSGRNSERTSSGSANSNSETGNAGSDGTRNGSGSANRNGRGSSTESGNDCASSGGRSGSSSNRNGDSTSSGGGCGGSKDRGGNETRDNSGRSNRDTRDSSSSSTERQPSSDKPREDDRQKSEQTRNSESSDTNTNNVKKRAETRKPPAPENRSTGDNRRENPLKPQQSGNDTNSDSSTQTQEQTGSQGRQAENRQQTAAESQTTTRADSPTSKTETESEGRQAEKKTASKPDATVSSREQSQKDFAETGKKFQGELSDGERREAHKAMAEQLKNISEKAGDKAAGDAVQNLNKQLEDSGSPYRFNTARMSNGQDFLSLKDADSNKLIDTRAFSDRKDPGQRAAEANQNFSELGQKFNNQMGDKERSAAHKELTDSLKKVSETSGDRGVDKAVDKLNEDLEKSGSPYKFNVARMPNGQDFLTVRDSDGKFLGTNKIQDAKPTPNQELDRTADRLTEKTSNGDRDNIHKDLTESIRKISEKDGADGVNKAVERLNERLEKNGSPYRFNTKQMSNGQDFLTMRDANKRLVNTRAFSQPRR